MSKIHPVTKSPIKLGRTVARRNAVSRAKASTMKTFLEELPAPPAAFDNTNGVKDWGMMRNDSLGDCTIAAPGHLIQAWTGAQGPGKMVTVPDQVIVEAYCEWDGYIPGDPASDQGGDVLTVCQDWKKFGLGGHFITAHAEVNMTQLRWQQAMWLFGGLNAGVLLPLTAYPQIGQTWDIVDFARDPSARANSWGGHCVAVVGYDPDGVTLVTWGALQRATWRFVMYYFDEAHAIISPDWPIFPGAATQHLISDLQAVGT